MPEHPPKRIDWNSATREVAPLGTSRVLELPSAEYLVETGERIYEIFEQDGRLSNGLTLDQIELHVESEREKIIRERFNLGTASGATGNSGQLIIKAPMPGLVRSLRVSTGDPVEKGGVLLVLEAMKMENNILASAKGIVKQIFVEEGHSVDKNKPMIELELV